VNDEVPRFPPGVEEAMFLTGEGSDEHAGFTVPLCRYFHVFGVAEKGRSLFVCGYPNELKVSEHVRERQVERGAELFEFDALHYCGFGHQ